MFSAVAEEEARRTTVNGILTDPLDVQVSLRRCRSVFGPGLCCHLSCTSQEISSVAADTAHEVCSLISLRQHDIISRRMGSYSFTEIYDQYHLADKRISWVECGRLLLGDMKPVWTSFSEAAGIEIDPETHDFFERDVSHARYFRLCASESNQCFHYPLERYEHRRSVAFRIEFYRTGEKSQDSCKDEDFGSPISSCMVPLNSEWAVPYIGYSGTHGDSLTRRCIVASRLSVTVLAFATTAPDKLIASVSLDVMHLSRMPVIFIDRGSY